MSKFSGPALPFELENAAAVTDGDEVATFKIPFNRYDLSPDGTSLLT
jgi:hypothetical protein